MGRFVDVDEKLLCGDAGCVDRVRGNGRGRTCVLNNSAVDAAASTSASTWHRYATNRMYGAPAVFASSCARFLRGLQPAVLAAEGGPHTVQTDIFPPARPTRSGRIWPLRAWNPSVVAAPVGLCPRCAFLTAVRVDARHQCDGSTPLSREHRQDHGQLFRGTAIIVLDASLRRLGATWLVNAPGFQVMAPSAAELANATLANERARMRKRIPIGAADLFDSSFSKQAYDVRLFSFGGHILATVVVPSTRQLNVIQLQVTANTTADGGLSHLRSWSSLRVVEASAWAGGRNQALFRSFNGELMVQPWLGLTATFGAPAFERRRARCGTPAAEPLPGVMKAALLLARAAAVAAVAVLGDGVAATHVEPAEAPRGSRRQCGTHADGQHVELDQMLWPGLNRSRGITRVPLRLNFNDSAVPELASFDGRLSATSHLIPVSRDGETLCHALLGVGHLHRVTGNRERANLCRRFKRRELYTPKESLTPCGADADPPKPVVTQPFHFGYLYTHFFYTVEPRPPYRTLSTSAEWCIGAAQNPADCESIQFVSGAVLVPPGRLLLAYGVNDCEAKLAEFSMERVWRMLRPVQGRTACLYE